MRRKLNGYLLCFILLASTLNADVPFMRGDVDQSGHLNLTDAVLTLRYLFLGDATPPCLDAADANDDSAVNITDPTYVLGFLFLGGSAPPAPYPDCGPDRTPDQLGCAASPAFYCQAVPVAIAARALSRHYVLVSFDGPVIEALLDPSIYVIRRKDGSTLAVLEVLTNPEDDRSVILVTDPQGEIELELAQGGGGATNSPIVFNGSDDAEPRPISAISLGSTQTEGRILLTYSEPMEEGLLDVRFYQISDPDLEIRSLALSTIGVANTTVILTTEPQRNLFYSLKVTNVKSRAGAFVIDPTRNIVTFQGIPAVDTTPPRVLGAEPTGNTTVVLTFSEPLAPGSEDPRNFIIRCFDPFTNTACQNLVIQGSELTSLGTQIVLTTLPQMPGMQYTVEILNRCGSLPDRDNCVKDIQENPISPTGNTAPFTGLDRDRPYLASAISLGPDAANPTLAYVLLTFSEPVLEGAETIAFYSITNPSLDIIAARLSLDGLTVTLTTSPQDPIEYLVKATNIVSRAGGFALDPTRSSAEFVGIPPVDTIRPRVTAAVSTSLTSVAVAFSEPIVPGAADALNFRITCRDPVSASVCPDLVVTGAALTNFGTQITLNTLPQTADVEYTVTVLDRCTEAKDACVKDLQGNRIDPAANSALFVFDGNPLLSEQRPRVVGAASTSNITVVVTFTKTMDRSVENASNYVIVQVNVNPEVGFLVVNSSRFLDPDHTSVELTTMSQNEVTYSVTAVNVRDLAGNQLEPPLVVPGVGLVSAGTAQFPGTPPTEGQIVDTDGDGLADNTEQRGRVVTVKLSDGSTIQRQVTSSPFSADTDLDGLDDPTELELGSDPRTADTDGDKLDDNTEFNIIFSNQNSQDSDSDGIDDNLEVEYFRTNANVNDSDGDGFTDAQGSFVMHRDPRIADLPSPGIGVDSLNLLLLETFTFTNDAGETQEQSSSTTTNVSSSATQTVSTKFGANLGFNVSGKFEGGNEGLTDPTLVPEPIALSEVEVGLNFGLSFEVSRESSQTMTESFEASLSKGRTVTSSLSSTRQVTGGRVDALVRLNNLSDVAFSLTNLEITVSAPDPINRTKFIPVATLVPNSELVTGNPAVFNVGVFNRGLGPILFSSRDVFPALVEDLLRDPRGLLFEIANYNVTDELGRNFAYASQMARDRTVHLSIDFGDGKPEQFLVAVAPVRNNRGEIVGGYGNFAGTGPLPGLPLEFILEQSLDLRRSRVQVPPAWTAAAGQRPLVETSRQCDAGDRAEEVCDVDADCPGGVCTAVVVPADGILVGGNGVSDSVAQGDDVQLIPFGIDGLPPEAVVIGAGEDGVLDTGARGDDILAVVTGYATTSSCGPDTPSSIRPGANGIVDTLRDPFSDDVQAVQPGLAAALTADVILPGPNGFIDTAAAGDDVFVGPGVPCSDDTGCPAPGACDGQERLFRFKHRERGQFGRAWAVLLTDSSQLGVDFRKILVRPGNHINLSFIQDLDRDGLISDVEFIFGSSDTRQDTDGDGLDDFSEIRVGWEVGVEGSPLRRVFPDPRFPDSDGDGLSDREEQDIRRVQCECDGGVNAGQSCTNILAEECPSANCVNVADRDANGSPTACSTLFTANRLDPRRRDTDDDLVRDADEVLGWLTQAAILDPLNVVVAGPNRNAETLACPDHECLGGANDGSPCRFDRDCPTLRRCEGGLSNDRPCTNDIECQGPTAATSGLCEEDPVEVGVCNRPTPCDDVQVIAPGAFAGNKNAVVVAPGPNGQLESAVRGDDVVVGNGARPGDRKVSSKALADDQQIRLAGECLRDDDLDGLCEGVCEGDPGVACERDSDCATRCISAPLDRVIIRPGVNGNLDTLPNNQDALGDDVRAPGQYLQTTNPLSGDTDRDQISEGFERILGSDPRNGADGGLLADKDGDGLTDGQEEFVGWIVRAVTAGGVVTRRVFSNPNTPDSDLDFLPDYVEHEIGTDPTSQDTDGDGLSDFDELSEAQLTDFARFNDFFPGFFLDGSLSTAYGTDPLSIDTDGDTLTDDFELLVGWSVTVPTERGQEVRHVLTDPTRRDTDFDGLNDSLERTHTVEGLAAPSSDPTDFDSDDDGRTDGNECPTASCQTNPLVPDKKVTIRYLQMTLERGSADGGLDLVDISYAFGAKRSDQPHLPSQQRFVVATADDCPGDFYSVCNPSQCQLKEGNEIVFNSSAARSGEILVNEKVYALKARQGILLSGVVDQWEGCPTNTLHVKGFCTDAAGVEGVSCCDTDGSTDCPAGQTCMLSSFEPRTCQGCGVVGVNGRSCRNDGDCIVALGPLTCGRCLGTACSGQPGPCVIQSGVNLECRPSTTTGPTGHISYLKSLSYETLQDGFSTDIVTLNDQGAGGIEQGFGVTLTVEIIVE